jgi:hypothetical protein
VFVFGVASNAANLQVFDLTNGGREPYRLHLRGAELQWLARSPTAPPVERAVHRQRAAQQARRTAVLRELPLTFGRRLTPSHQAGVLLGVSSDVNLSRDPDATHGSLQISAANTFDLDSVLSRPGAPSGSFTLTVRAFLDVRQDGEYWFSVYADDASCLAIDQQTVLACHSGVNEGVASLTRGTHRVDFRYIYRDAAKDLRLRWMPPGARQFSPFPQHALLLPAGSPRPALSTQ